MHSYKSYPHVEADMKGAAVAVLLILIAFPSVTVSAEKEEKPAISFFIAGLEESLTDEELALIFSKTKLLSPSKHYNTDFGSLSIGVNPFGGALIFSTASSPGLSGVPDKYHHNLVFPDNRDIDRILKGNGLNLKSVEDSALYKGMSALGTLLYVFGGDYDESDLYLSPTLSKWEIRHSGINGR